MVKVITLLPGPMASLLQTLHLYIIACLLIACLSKNPEQARAERSSPTHQATIVASVAGPLAGSAPKPQDWVMFLLKRPRLDTTPC